jgi:hypothetical protein
VARARRRASTPVSGARLASARAAVTCATAAA